eukprot:gene20278-biopygen7049
MLPGANAQFITNPFPESAVSARSVTNATRAPFFWTQRERTKTVAGAMIFGTLNAGSVPGSTPQQEDTTLHAPGT